MPWINGRFYANPTYGRAVERARENGRGASLLDLDTAENEDANGHWVTIGGRHVLIQGGPKEGSNAPKDSRSDLVLIPAGSGKPRANLDMNGFWTISWKLRERNGDILEPLGNKYSGSVVQLTESINGGPFKAAGNQKGGFRDIISPETRTIIQEAAEETVASSRAAPAIEFSLRSNPRRRAFPTAAPRTACIWWAARSGRLSDLPSMGSEFRLCWVVMPWEN